MMHRTVYWGRFLAPCQPLLAALTLSLSALCRYQLSATGFKPLIPVDIDKYLRINHKHVDSLQRNADAIPVSVEFEGHAA